MKKFETPEIKRFPLVIKDHITDNLDGYMDGFKDGSGDVLPEDELGNLLNAIDMKQESPNGLSYFGYIVVR